MNQSPLASMFPLLIIVAFFIWMMYSQSKDRKKIAKFRAQLQPGDEVITTGGVYGTVREVKEGALMIEVAQHVVVKVDLNNVFPTVNSASAVTTK